MMKLAICILISAFASQAWASHLFQSTKDADKSILVPRDIKKTTLIISISKDCAECGSTLQKFLQDFVQKSQAEINLLITVDGGLWRKAGDILNKATWIPISLNTFTYHDPAGRFRADLGNDKGTYLVLMDESGNIRKKERMSAKTTYQSFFSPSK